METDFTALASRVAASADLRACIILSKDGLVLGAFPPNGDAEARPSWLRVSALGEPDRGFVSFPAEIWAFVRRGPYAAFAIGPADARPGVVLDHLEQALLVAEDSRARRDAARAPDQIDLARQGVRAPLHAPARPAPAAVPAAPVATGDADPAPPPPPASTRADSDDVDRVSLAFELSHLLQEGYSRDE